MLNIIALTLVFSQILVGSYYFSNNKKIYIQKDLSRSLDNVYHIAKNDENISVDDSVIFKITKSSKLDFITHKYNLSMVNKIQNNVYVAHTNKHADDTISIANNLYQDNLIIYAHPNFKIQLKQHGLNPLKSYATYLSDINIDTLWKYSKGKGVKIGIIDDYVDTAHPDLKDNHISSYINKYTTDKTYHGTHCLGIISALDNDIGSVGIAPDSKYYVATFANTLADFIKSIYYFLDKDVAVVNNSWGTLLEIDALNDALEVLAKQGRGGKGSVLVFASGNKDYNLDTNKTDLSELPFVLGVGALDEYNKKTSYSNYGSNIDIYAYGGENAGLITTDEAGNKGYSTANYRFNFHGTSAAAPVVSGVVALMMGVDNDLLASKAIEIIKQTATFSEDGYPVLNAKKALSQVYINKYKSPLFDTNNSYLATLGWNLLGVNKDTSLKDINSKFSNPKIVWTYDNNVWQKNPSYIPANRGFWIKLK